MPFPNSDEGDNHTTSTAPVKARTRQEYTRRCLGGLSTAAGLSWRTQKSRARPPDSTPTRRTSKRPLPTQRAARTPAGREKLVTWLKFLENRSGSQTNPTDPMATYDFGWLWRELGVENQRR